MTRRIWRASLAIAGALLALRAFTAPATLDAPVVTAPLPPIAAPSVVGDPAADIDEAALNAPAPPPPPIDLDYRPPAAPPSP